MLAMLQDLIRHKGHANACLLKAIRELNLQRKTSSCRSYCTTLLSRTAFGCR